MSSKIRKLSCLAGVAGAALATSILTTGTAHAATWLSDPGGCANAATAVNRGVSGRTVEVRFGTCSGVQHGWGRITGYGSGDFIRFEVDTNGDRVQDGASWFLATNRNYTAAYPTSADPNRAFRACFVTSSSGLCNSNNSTPWW
jgi:hypothetical protein